MKKRTKSETRGRRSHHALKVKTLAKCPQCGQAALPHTACAICGTYKGREVVKVKTAATKAAKAKTTKPAAKKTVAKSTAKAKAGSAKKAK